MSSDELAWAPVQWLPLSAEVHMLPLGSCYPSRGLGCSLPSAITCTVTWSCGDICPLCSAYCCSTCRFGLMMLLASRC